MFLSCGVPDCLTHTICHGKGAGFVLGSVEGSGNSSASSVLRVPCSWLFSAPLSMSSYSQQSDFTGQQMQKNKRSCCVCSPPSRGSRGARGAGSTPPQPARSHLPCGSPGTVHSCHDCWAPTWPCSSSRSLFVIR